MPVDRNPYQPTVEAVSPTQPSTPLSLARIAMAFTTAMFCIVYATGAILAAWNLTRIEPTGVFYGDHQLTDFALVVFGMCVLGICASVLAWCYNRWIQSLRPSPVRLTIAGVCAPIPIFVIVDRLF
ncbi:hypothetical protein NZK35_25715 [Stieleria sp. ICT_E10.1]|uniref:hypothetical protein n=1 Tax=Stieleria sedimenti TaxID=2976331 RepID=UPI00217FB507|nr:hypothetical protein [Stieleria sedimenti]MCS7470056.1 hypothetical protein [Stieleria sedimenti]